MHVLHAFGGQWAVDMQAVREIWFHSRLSHPNIISMYAAWKEDGKICMALEYASGGSSFKRLRRVGRYREDVCAPRIILPVLCAVKFLHDLGLIHRDIKPENILLTDDGAKLADLGLVISHRDEPPNSCLGTFDYMVCLLALESWARVSPRWLYLAPAASPPRCIPMQQQAH